jgi:septum formation protein
LPRLVLASSSKTRIGLLENAGLSFDAIPVRIDEEAIRRALLAEDAPPRDVADALAEFKARKGQEKRPEALVLGADQVLALKGRIFSKPADRAEAADHLATLQGQRHRLLSCAVLYHGGEPIWRATGEARLTMHPLAADEIEAYLDRAWPGVANSVGAYHAEGIGARLFSRIEGDWFSVLGLPLLDLLSYLRTRGWLS